MKTNNLTRKAFYLGAATMLLLSSCDKQDKDTPSEDGETITELSAAEIAVLEAEADAEDALEALTGKRGDFNISDWNLSVPVSDGNGPTDLYPTSLNNLSNKATGDLKDFVKVNSANTYVDLTCYYTGVKTSSSTSYSRTEFREFWNGASNNNVYDNWDLDGKHVLIARLRVREASTKVVIAQIHGKKRNTNTSSEPPMIKVQWESGKIKALYKEGSNTSWSDADKVNIDTEKFKSGNTVGTLGLNEEFVIKLRVKDGKLYYRLTVGSEDTGYKYLYDYSNKGWDNYYNNYFKAGNYLQSSSSSDKAVVRVLELQTVHN